MTLSTVSTLCNGVMRAVVASGLVHEGNLDCAVTVMRAEVKALMFGDEYADERACILAGSVSEQTVLASVVASCILKLKAA